MDSFRSFEDDIGPQAAEDEPAMEAPPEIGIDERRMHVRAYNYWVSLLGGRAYPAIQDVDPASIDDFGPHSVLLDFSAGSSDPGIAFIGGALRHECGLDRDIRFISEVPQRSLLSRLTDHYLQIIANCAPIGFEAEFVGQRGSNTLYRGILMPLSSDGDTIDYIYGVINWKETADGEIAAGLAEEVDRAVAAAPPPSANPVWADGPSAEAPAHETAPASLIDAELELGVERDQDAFEFSLPQDAGLADRLVLARESADEASSADLRSRASLYRALGHVYDFARAAEDAPDDLAELLADAGLSAQTRAPMTPIVKLVFGARADKARVTEYAAALSLAHREDVAAGAFTGYLEGYAGGLKAMIAAERRHRRPEAIADDAGAAAREALRGRSPLGYVEIDGGEEEFVLLVARREPDGRLAIVAPVAADPALIDRAIRKAA